MLSALREKGLENVIEKYRWIKRNEVEKLVAIQYSISVSMHFIRFVTKWKWSSCRNVLYRLFHKNDVNCNCRFDSKILLPKVLEYLKFLQSFCLR